MPANRELDFGWWQPAGQTGVRLSYHLDAQVLYLFHADSGKEEVVGSCDKVTAMTVGAVWLDRGGPGYVRRSVT